MTLQLNCSLIRTMILRRKRHEDPRKFNYVIGRFESDSPKTTETDNIETFDVKVYYGTRKEANEKASELSKEFTETLKPVFLDTHDELQDLYQSQHSARYILTELFESGERGIELLADLTGNPEGVISAAFKNIFKNYDDNQF